MRRRLSLWVAVTSLVAAAAGWWGCSERVRPGYTPAAGVVQGGPSAGPGAGSGGSGEGGAGGAPTYLGAAGVQLTDMVLHQGPARPLLTDRVPVAGGPAIIAGRPALLRLFYDTDSGYDDGEVTVWLRIGEDYIVSQQLTLASDPSVPEALSSTINFDIPAGVIQPDADWAVSIEQPDAERLAEDNPEARYPEDDGAGLLPEVGEGHILRVTVVPIRYDADGSQRLPDTSAEHLAAYRDQLMSMLPVRDVEVTLREPLPYASVLLPTISLTYEDLRDALAAQRQIDGAGDDMYYFGVVEPGFDQQLYCNGGCIVGSSYIAGLGESDKHVAVALSWSDFDRAIVHELGHTLGRTHPGCDVLPEDPLYPYLNAELGVYAYDIVTAELHPPDHHSIMSYCQPAFVSDYGWDLFAARLQLVYGDGTSP